MFTKSFWASLALVCTLGLLPLYADVVCDGTNDTMASTAILSDFMSVGTGSLLVWFKPTGTAESTSGNCEDAGTIVGDNDGFLGIQRSPNLTPGLDRICIFNWDGTGDAVATAYTVDAWTHLVWVHTGGNVLGYKDGALISSTASGNTQVFGGVLTVCKRWGGSLFESGTIGQFTITSVAYTADQVAALGKSRLYRMEPTVRTGSWDFAGCGDGVDCNAKVHADRSGNGRTLTSTGGTGAASNYLSYPWGVE